MRGGRGHQVHASRAPPTESRRTHLTPQRGAVTTHVTCRLPGSSSEISAWDFYGGWSCGQLLLGVHRILASQAKQVAAQSTLFLQTVSLSSQFCEWGNASYKTPVGAGLAAGLSGDSRLRMALCSAFPSPHSYRPSFNRQGLHPNSFSALWDVGRLPQGLPSRAAPGFEAAPAHPVCSSCSFRTGVLELPVSQDPCPGDSWKKLVALEVSGQGRPSWLGAYSF